MQRAISECLADKEQILVTRVLSIEIFLFATGDMTDIIKSYDLLGFERNSQQSQQTNWLDNNTIFDREQLTARAD